MLPSVDQGRFSRRKSVRYRASKNGKGGDELDLPGSAML